MYGGDSDTETPRRSQPGVTNLDVHGASQVQPNDHESSHKAGEKSSEEKKPNFVETKESIMSMGDILSSMEPGISFSHQGNGLREEKPSNKTNGQSVNSKRPNFWGRNIVCYPQKL